MESVGSPAGTLGAPKLQSLVAYYSGFRIPTPTVGDINPALPRISQEFTIVPLV